MLVIKTPVAVLINAETLIYVCNYFIAKIKTITLQEHCILRNLTNNVQSLVSERILNAHAHPNVQKLLTADRKS